MNSLNTQTQPETSVNQVVGLYATWYGSDVTYTNIRKFVMALLDGDSCNSNLIDAVINLDVYADEPDRAIRNAIKKVDHDLTRNNSRAEYIRVLNFMYSNGIKPVYSSIINLESIPNRGKPILTVAPTIPEQTFTVPLEKIAAARVRTAKDRSLAIQMLKDCDAQEKAQDASEKLILSQMRTHCINHNAQHGEVRFESLKAFVQNSI